MAETNDLVVATFAERWRAEQAVAELSEAGFPLSSMDVITRGKEATRAKEASHLSEAAAEGSVAGALTGGTAGMMAGALATMLIPGLGAVLGGGLLVGALGGAALGAAGGAFLGPFIALSMSDEEARFYARHLEEGRTVVVVKTTDRHEDVRQALGRNGGRNYAGTLEKANLV